MYVMKISTSSTNPNLTLYSQQFPIHKLPQLISFKSIVINFIIGYHGLCKQFVTKS